MRSAYASILDEAFEANREIARLGLSILTWGNASSFDPAAGLFAIKPSGVEYSALRPESMVLVDLEGRVAEGSLKPSSDMRTHLELYRSFDEIKGVCHTHSPHAVAWAQARRSIPCLGTTHADEAAGPIPCSSLISESALADDYELGTGRLIVQAFEGKDHVSTPMILVAGHGPFTWGKSAMDAVRHAAALEEVARMAILTLEIVKVPEELPEYISKKHWARKHGTLAYYGQF